MGLLSGMQGGMDHLVKTKSRSKSDASNMQPGSPAGGGAAAQGEASGYDTTNLDKEQGNVLMSIISQRTSLSIGPPQDDTLPQRELEAEQAR